MVLIIAILLVELAKTEAVNLLQKADLIKKIYIYIYIYINNKYKKIIKK